jgi:hypothetical protein
MSVFEQVVGMIHHVAHETLGLEKTNSKWPLLTAIEQQKQFLEINVGYAGSDILYFLEQQKDYNSHSSVYTIFSYCY